jgi:hypothetical protein
LAFADLTGLDRDGRRIGLAFVPARPVFADVDAERVTLDPSACAAAVTSKTRAIARTPKLSARAPTAHTSLSGATRLPWNGVPCGSRK